MQFDALTKVQSNNLCNRSNLVPYLIIIFFIYIKALWDPTLDEFASFLCNNVGNRNLYEILKGADLKFSFALLDIPLQYKSMSKCTYCHLLLYVNMVDQHTYLHLHIQYVHGTWLIQSNDFYCIQIHEYICMM